MVDPVQKLVNDKVVLEWRSAISTLERCVSLKDVKSLFLKAYTAIVNTSDSLLSSHLVGLCDIATRISQIELVDIKYGDLPPELISALANSSNSNNTTSNDELLYYAEAYQIYNRIIRNGDSTNNTNNEYAIIKYHFNRLINLLDAYPLSKANRVYGSNIRRNYSNFLDGLDIEPSFTEIYNSAIQDKLLPAILSSMFEIKVALLSTRKESRITSILEETGLIEAAKTKVELINTRLEELKNNARSS